MRHIHAHELGTEVQEKSGRVRKKVGDGTWMGRNRYNWMRHYKKEIPDNCRIYHRNGDKADDSIDNLIDIHFSTKVYALKHSQVVFVPKKTLKAKPYMPRPLEMAEATA